jgi:hypothetical protein
VNIEEEVAEIGFDWPASVCYLPSVLMPMKLCKYLLRSRRLRRSLAVLLLAFAVFDLAIVDTFFPQLCNDEHLSSALIESTEAAINKSVAIANHESQPSRNSLPSSTPASTDEDCFCCCSHIVLGYAVNAVASPAPPSAIIPIDDILPSAPAQDTYRPPRIA